MRLSEEEWLHTADPWVMLNRQWPRKTTDRKLWLFAVACWRLIPGGHLPWYMPAALESLENFADLPPEVQRQEQWEPMGHALTQGGPPDESLAALRDGSTPEGAAWQATSLVGWTVLSPAERSIIETYRYETEGTATRSGDAAVTAWQRQLRQHCELLRHTVGNPFRPQPAVDPLWLSHGGGLVPALARSIYDGKRFDELPVLADALEDAGCTDAEILTHLRGPEEHMRGCWALDLLLGKHYLA